MEKMEYAELPAIAISDIREINYIDLSSSSAHPV
jgi:hypothetical protein